MLYKKTVQNFWLKSVIFPPKMEAQLKNPTTYEGNTIRMVVAGIL